LGLSPGLYAQANIAISTPKGAEQSTSRTQDEAFNLRAPENPWKWVWRDRGRAFLRTRGDVPIHSHAHLPDASSTIISLGQSLLTSSAYLAALAKAPDAAK